MHPLPTRIRTVTPGGRALLDHLDLLTELLAPSRRPQDAGVPECSRTELRVLSALGRKEPMGTTALAVALAIPASTLTRAIDQLVKKGLVARRRDVRDHRAIEVAFSAYGKEINRYVVRSRLLAAQRLLRKLSAAERKGLLAGLAALVNQKRNHG